MVASTTANDSYDIIIIGSGLGALSTASIMAQLYDKRVLVIERHYVIGGFTHSFKRPDRRPDGEKTAKYEWDVGVHYVGRMGESDAPRRLFDFVTGGQLQWNRMSDPFEMFHYPGFSFEVHGDRDRFRNELVAQFPAEIENIDAMLIDIEKMRAWSNRRMGAAIMPQPLSGMLRLWNKLGEARALRTTHDYLEQRFDDPRLRALLASQWGTYALSPKQSPFQFHALIMNHYMQGGYYPRGGAGAIARSVIPIVQARGGMFLASHSVDSIIVEDARAVGVEVIAREGGREIRKTFRAPVIVSNVGAYNTHAKLLAPEIGAKRAAWLEQFLAPTTCVSVYLGLRASAATLGLRGENHWIFRSLDHEDNADTTGLLEGRPNTAYLSFASLKDPGMKSHTAEIMGFTRYEDFQRWSGKRWKKRGPEYEALKSTIATGLIELAETKIPGLAQLIDHVEVATPLTTEHFTDQPRGQIYSLAMTPERVRQLPYGARTSVKGLYLTGADVFSLGVVPALLSGLMTAGAIMGPLGFPKVVRAMKAFKARGAAKTPQ